ncbi:MAG TPA: LysM peptidoglycan-binding domain-containing protein [Bacillales bacterium]
MKKLLTTLFAALFALAIIIPSSANAASQTTYTVHSGDTMWKISQKFDVNFGSLVEANPQIDNPSVIYVGQQIRIPGSSDSGSGNNVYTVKHGDTMWKISQSFDVSYAALLEANPQIHNPSMIYVGQSVNIPGQSSQPGGTGSTQSNSSVLSQYEQKVVELTNKERTERGLQPLKVAVELSKMGDVKAEDMRDNHYFSHTSPTYGSPFDMMKQFGISYSYAGENIAAGQRTPQEVVNAWMNSPGHRRNILNSHYTYIGVGYTDGGSYGSYWVQEFIRK